jgi:CMP-N,N'-diacetyllegionaminic acid synthase
MKNKGTPKKNFFLSLIPAKKNSNELSKKNFLKLNNISLYKLALLSSLNSNYIHSTFVSSDSKKILNDTEKLGAISIKRPRKLCLRNTLAKDVVYHFIKYIKKEYNLDNLENFNIVYLQPTSPFRSHLHVDKAIKFFIKNKSQPIISIVDSKKPLEKSLKIVKRRVFPVSSYKKVTLNRQKLEKTFFPNGAIYIFKINDFLKQKDIPIKKAFGFEMDQVSSIDIDDFFDYQVASFFSKKLIKFRQK